VVVSTLDTRSNERTDVRCKRLVLAAGALGTARIALRSHGPASARTPLLCNPYSYLPCIVPSRLGHAMPERNIALSQLALFHDPGQSHRDVAMGFVYSYRSLMMFRLMNEIPLAFNIAAEVVRFLMSGFLIVGVHHPHANQGGSYVSIETDAASLTGDRLFVHFELTPIELRAVTERERAFSKCLRSLGAYPARVVRPGNGASIHYAGTVPYSEAEEPLTTGADGRLNGTQRVFVADSSSFTFLPAKGVTLSAMARAHAVAKHLPQA
jgi:hypothetical protein